MLRQVSSFLAKLMFTLPLGIGLYSPLASAQVFPGIPGFPGIDTSEFGRCGGTKTFAGLSTCQTRVEKLPQNQSLNLLDISGQIIREDYWRINSDPSEGNCSFRTAQALQRYPEGSRAYYYYHRDSNFLGIADGDGHCYAWIYNPSADRLSVIYSVLAGALLSQAPRDISPIINDLTAKNAAAPWKADGIRFQHFGFNAVESSDVCLKKVNAWRLSFGAAWSVWSHQAGNCFGIASQYSFAQ